MKENHLITQKTGRYYTLGELNTHTRHVWFVLHGFGQLAGKFIQNFEPLLVPGVFIIAPEALNHFYLKGPGGEVGATWMTKEDRLNEIKDYVNYLDDVYEQFDLEQYPETKITALGFSQGSSTVSRWVNATQHRMDTVICYAGEVGAEVFPIHEQSMLRRSNNHYFYGTRDEYFPLELIREAATSKYSEMNFTIHEFEGGHEIKPELLKPLLD